MLSPSMMLLRVVVTDHANCLAGARAGGDRRGNRRTREHDAHLLADTLNRKPIGRDPGRQPLECRAIGGLTVDLPTDPANWIRQGIAKNPPLTT